MRKQDAHALTFNTLVKTPLCRCMRIECSSLHYADLSDEQRKKLVHHWEHPDEWGDCCLCLGGMDSDNA